MDDLLTRLLWMTVLLAPFWALPILVSSWRRLGGATFLWAIFGVLFYWMMQRAGERPQTSLINGPALIWFLLLVGWGVGGGTGLMTQALVLSTQRRRGIVRFVSFLVMLGAAVLVVEFGMSS